MVYIANSERTTSKVIGWTCPYKQSKLNSFKRNHDKAVACFKWKLCRGGILYPKSFDTQLRIVVFTKQKLLKRKKEIAVRKKNKNPCVCLKISLIYASFHFRLYIPFPCKIISHAANFLSLSPYTIFKPCDGSAYMHVAKLFEWLCIMKLHIPVPKLHRKNILFTNLRNC